MKKITLLFFATLMLLPAFAQEQKLSVEEVSALSDVECRKYYSAPWNKNWFLQIGAGVDVPFLEHDMKGTGKTAKHRVTPSFNIGVGHWMSPYLALRFSALGGEFKWDSYYHASAKYASLNFDLMWDMFNSFTGLNNTRVFSIVPFIGFGAAVTWDIDNISEPVVGTEGVKSRSWTFPLSAGLQFRFRLNKYVDLFLEGRAQFLGDNFNGCVYGNPIDINPTAIAGVTYTIGGRYFDTVNPCEYIDYINNLNDKVNNLRGDIANTAAALAAAEAQLPCPEVKEVVCPEAPEALLAAVQFTINSSKVHPLQKTHIYNLAEWMKANEEYKLEISGYADKNTGNARINERIAKKRAQDVYDQFVKYGINEERLEINTFGDTVQPYPENNWNRVVVFKLKK